MSGRAVRKAAPRVTSSPRLGTSKHRRAAIVPATTRMRAVLTEATDGGRQLPQRELPLQPASVLESERIALATPHPQSLRRIGSAVGIGVQHPSSPEVPLKKRGAIRLQ
jgi:hypothetical protein